MNEMGYVLTEEECSEMILYFDKDGDGEIDFCEFIKVMLYDTEDESLFDVT